MLYYFYVTDESCRQVLVNLGQSLCVQHLASDVQTTVDKLLLGTVTDNICS